MKSILEIEVKLIQKAIASFSSKIQLAYIFVNKRTNLKFFEKVSTHHSTGRGGKGS
jgi:hypothetical protein